MNPPSKPPAQPQNAAQLPQQPSESANVQIDQNITAVHDFYTREVHKLGAAQRWAERLGDFVGRPFFLVLIFWVALVWMAANLVLGSLNRTVLDHPPFHWLQGALALAALVVATVVLIKQNRVARLSEQRDHLDLKLTMLIEQKTAKLIDLMEELRRDLPSVKNRHDAGATEMQQAMSPASVIAALDEELISPDGSTSPSTAPV